MESNSGVGGRMFSLLEEPAAGFAVEQIALRRVALLQPIGHRCIAPRRARDMHLPHCHQCVQMRGEACAIASPTCRLASVKTWLPQLPKEGIMDRAKKGPDQPNEQKLSAAQLAARHPRMGSVAQSRVRFGGTVWPGILKWLFPGYRKG
jgi:hypothetical protein